MPCVIACLCFRFRNVLLLIAEVHQVFDKPVAIHFEHQEADVVGIFDILLRENRIGRANIVFELFDR